MIKILALFLVSLSVFITFNLAQAEIVEVKKMEAVSGLIDRETLVVFDIDNTLIHPSQSLGSDPWFSYTISAFMKGGDLAPVALEKTIALWQQVNLVTKVKPVESRTPYFIHQLQEAHVQVIALTSRASNFAPVTERQLAQVNIDFSKSPVGSLGDFTISNGVRYRRGVVSVTGQDKGTILLEIIQHYNLNPSRVVFVDDQLRNVQSVEKALADKFSVYSVRYGYEDERVKLFDSRITDLEGTIFWSNGHLISDERAKRILNYPTDGQFSAQY